MHYFLLHDAADFAHRVRPALSASWHARSFEPCRTLCTELAPAASDFTRRYGADGDEPFVARVARGLPFDRDLWRLLVGEVLLYAALELPEIQTTPESVVFLLTRRRCAIERERFAPIEQAYFGSRDLVFGGYYRPEHAGLNDPADVARLSDYLATLRPEEWTDLEGLPGLSPDERDDELDFAREWFPALQELYREARARKLLVLCEIL